MAFMWDILRGGVWQLVRGARGHSWPLAVLLLPTLSACSTFDDWQRLKVYRPTRIESSAALQALQVQWPSVATQTVHLPNGEQLQVLQVMRISQENLAPERSNTANDATEIIAVNEAKQPIVNVLYLHGTVAHAWGNMAKIQGITRNGLNVFAPDYRGWGSSSPRLPDEASIHEDAWATWQYLQALQALQAAQATASSAAAAATSSAPSAQANRPVRWVIYGHSMGSAVAVRLAQRLKHSAPKAYCALVLESSFTSFPDVARSASTLLGPLAAGLSSQKMASIERIADVQGPLWLLHGTQDSTIPIALGRQLFEAAPEPKTWLELPYAHSNLQTDTSGQYYALWRSVLATCEAPERP